MAKPVVTARMPPVWMVGQPARVEVEVAASETARIEFIDVGFVGAQGWSVGSGNSRRREKVAWPELMHRVMEEGLLEAGTTRRFVTELILPPGTPPSHEVAPAFARVHLRIHVSLPWRIDVRERYPIAARIPPPDDVRRLPVVHQSRGDHDAPRIELSLASSRVVVGEHLVGTVAVFNLDDTDPRTVRLALIPAFELHAGRRSRDQMGSEITHYLEIPAGSAGRPMPFRLQVPPSIPPGFRAVSHDLSWWLQVRSGSFVFSFGRKAELMVPLDVVDASAAAPRLPPPPRVGDAAIAAAFEQVAAAEQWEISESATDHDVRFLIDRSIGEVVARISYAFRNEHGAHLVSTLEYPELGLALSISPSSSLRHVFFRDVEVGDSEWDRAHHVRARSEPQAKVFLEALVPLLVEARDLGVLTQLRDDALLFSAPVTDVDVATLAMFARALERLAMAIPPALARIPPPPTVSVDLAAWAALASRFGGKVTTGDLSLDGHVDGLPLEVRLDWDEEARPTAIAVAVGEPEASSDRLREVQLELAQPSVDYLVSSAAQIAELVQSWPEDVRTLVVKDGVASARIVLADDDVRPLPSERVRDLVHGLRAVLRALDPGAGPYR